MNALHHSFAVYLSKLIASGADVSPLARQVLPGSVLELAVAGSCLHILNGTRLHMLLVSITPPHPLNSPRTPQTPAIMSLR